MFIPRNLLGAGVLGLASLFTASTAMALTDCDLTSGGTCTINGGIFTTNSGTFIDTSPLPSTGTGIIAPFVRIQANGTEEGYNTDNRPVQFDEKGDQNFTHSVNLNELEIANGYYEFLLDLNEPSGGTQPLLSLDQLRIFQSTDKDVTATGTPVTFGASAQLIYNLDAGADHGVKLDFDNASSGSGRGDMLFRVLASLFNPATHPWLIFYSQFGTDPTSGDGFEEWTVRTTVQPPPIPLPATIWMLLAAMGGIGFLGKRQQATA